jgi:signal transduction histidine kinase
MKLAWKLTLALLLGIVAVVGIDTWYGFRNDVRQSRNQLSQDLRVVGRELSDAFGLVWRDRGEDAALKLIQDTNALDTQIDVRWVVFDAHPPDPEAPRMDPQQAQALVGTENYGFGLDDNGVEHLCVYVPVAQVSSSHPGVLEISQDLNELHAFEQSQLRAAAVEGALVATICSIIVLTLGLVLIGRPMRELSQMAQRIGSGDLTHRLTLGRRDEIGQLADEMNRMSERLLLANDDLRRETEARMKTLDQLRHNDRLATVGRLASGIAHELGTPLNVISGRARMITGEPDDTQNAGIIVGQADRIAGIIRQLLDFARRRGPNLAQVDLAELAQRTLDLLRPLAGKRGIDLRFESFGGDPARTEADYGQLQQALTNLVLNGVQAMAAGGELAVRLTRERARPPSEGGSEAEYYCLRVTDHGEGISPDLVPHLFEPFFTTKDVGEGTGLGLSVAYGIVQDHGGFISVDSTLGHGSTFAMFLPVEPVAHAVVAA